MTVDRWTFTVGGRAHAVADYWAVLHSDVPWHETPCVCGWVLTYGYTTVFHTGQCGTAYPALKCDDCGAVYPAA